MKQDWTTRFLCRTEPVTSDVKLNLCQIEKEFSAALNNFRLTLYSIKNVRDHIA